MHLKHCVLKENLFLLVLICLIRQKDLCDRIVVLKKGTLIMEGTIEDLRHKVNAGEDTSLEDLFLEVTEDEKE